MPAHNTHDRVRTLSPTLTAVFGVALGALFVIALFPLFPRQFNIRVGDVGSRTVTSPRDVTFESESRTEQKRDEAGAAVLPVQVFDPEVRTRQFQEYDATVTQIGRIRTDNIEEARKRDQLADLGLSQ